MMPSSTLLETLFSEVVNFATNCCQRIFLGMIFLCLLMVSLGMSLSASFPSPSRNYFIEQLHYTTFLKLHSNFTFESTEQGTSSRRKREYKGVWYLSMGSQPGPGDEPFIKTGVCIRFWSQGFQPLLDNLSFQHLPQPLRDVDYQMKVIGSPF